MMQVRLQSRFEFGDIVALYLLDPFTGRIGFWLVPADAAGAIERIDLAAAEYEIAKEHGQPKWSIDPLVHIQRSGDAYPLGFAQGRTLRNGPSTAALKFVSQDVQECDCEKSIVTQLAADDGLAAEHRLTWRKGESALRVQTTIRNNSNDPVSLELLTSFSLGGITPFAVDSAAGRLMVHRVRSSWASEGRLESRSAESMQLEPSFSRFSAACERFGQVGTMPTRGFFPFVAVEDAQAGVIWGAQLAWAGSWQMEVYRRDDTLSLSGGLADYEFGHWKKTLQPGESLTAPEAMLTCVRGDLETLCDRLIESHQPAIDQQPANEQDLPIIFNEWCTTWGRPSHDKVLAIADRLAGTGVKYLVIDAGWYQGHGDWCVRPDRFPDLKATAAALRQRGMVPGLWFEYENCAPGSAMWERADWHLHRDGKPLQVNDRRFFDMTNPEVIAYLADRVIGTLRDNDIGYLKIDYNETIGLGADGCESLGEKLRQQTTAMLDFVGRIRRELPHVVIENCASGGHRLEPSMLALTAMSSFSDAHESTDIPVIAANLHRVMQPRQSQIWAVLRKADTERRQVYSLAATFLGRMCISGDITELSDEQMAVYRAAAALYRKAWPIIKNGHTRRTGEPLSYRALTGSQTIFRTATDGRSAFVVVHTFADAKPVDVALNGYRIVDSFVAADATIDVAGEIASLTLDNWSAAVLLLSRKSGPSPSGEVR